MNKHLKKTALIAALIVGTTTSATYAQKATYCFRKAPGMVSYTYRNSFQKDVPAGRWI